MEEWSSLYFSDLIFHYTSQPESEFMTQPTQVGSATDAPYQNYSELTYQARY
jgi:hypothetical protein